jgi:hypothetical protein
LNRTAASEVPSRQIAPRRARAGVSQGFREDGGHEGSGAQLPLVPTFGSQEVAAPPPIAPLLPPLAAFRFRNALSLILADLDLLPCRIRGGSAPSLAPSTEGSDDG